MEKKIMKNKFYYFLSIIMAFSLSLSAQPDEYKPDPQSVLQLIRKEKIKHVLPLAMRNNNIDMWIHVTRAGDPDPLEYEFGSTSGYLIFTDLGDRIEKAVFAGYFGGEGGIEDIDVRASTELRRAITGYDYGKQNFSVYKEITNYVSIHNPKTIAVNYSDWISVADGISHTQFEKLKRILGPKYAKRIVSAEDVITEFRSRRVLREIVVQANTLEIARQKVLNKIKKIIPGKTTLGKIGGARIYYSEKSEPLSPPLATSWIRHPGYVFQRGDFFTIGDGAKWMDFGFGSFGVDTKTHVYILKEGETSPPKSIQYAWDQGKKAQSIMRKYVAVGMTAGESLQAIIDAMEAEGYIYTPFTDDPREDYLMLQKALKNTNKSGFYLDLHAMGNNGGDLVTVGPSIAPFRRDRDHVVIHENHIFAFEYAVHTNLPERPGYPISINFSNPQVVTNYGVEWIQPPNDKIILIY